MNFLEFHRYEMDALKKSPFELWAEKVEKILGHDLDGDQSIDGYSLDFASDAFDAGASAKKYAASVREVERAIILATPYAPFSPLELKELSAHVSDPNLTAATAAELIKNRACPKCLDGTCAEHEVRR